MGDGGRGSLWPRRRGAVARVGLATALLLCVAAAAVRAEFEPLSYCYGQSQRVLTMPRQRCLECLDAHGRFNGSYCELDATRAAAMPCGLVRGQEELCEANVTVLLSAGITSQPQFGFPNDAPLCMCYPALHPLPDMLVTSVDGEATITVLAELNVTYCTCAAVVLLAPVVAVRLFDRLTCAVSEQVLVAPQWSPLTSTLVLAVGILIAGIIVHSIYRHVLPGVFPRYRCAKFLPDEPMLRRFLQLQIVALVVMTLFSATETSLTFLASSIGHYFTTRLLRAYVPIGVAALVSLILSLYGFGHFINLYRARSYLDLTALIYAKGAVFLRHKRSLQLPSLVTVESLLSGGIAAPSGDAFDDDADAAARADAARAPTERSTLLAQHSAYGVDDAASSDSMSINADYSEMTAAAAAAAAAIAPVVPRLQAPHAPLMRDGVPVADVVRGMAADLCHAYGDQIKRIQFVYGHAMFATFASRMHKLGIFALLRRAGYRHFGVHSAPDPDTLRWSILRNRPSPVRFGLLAIVVFFSAIGISASVTVGAFLLRLSIESGQLFVDSYLARHLALLAPPLLVSLASISANAIVRVLEAKRFTFDDRQAETSRISLTITLTIVVKLSMPILAFSVAVLLPGSHLADGTDLVALASSYLSQLLIHSSFLETGIFLLQPLYIARVLWWHVRRTAACQRCLLRCRRRRAPAARGAAASPVPAAASSASLDTDDAAAAADAGRSSRPAPRPSVRLPIVQRISGYIVMWSVMRSSLIIDSSSLLLFGFAASFLLIDWVLRSALEHDHVFEDTLRELVLSFIGGNAAIAMTSQIAILTVLVACAIVFDSYAWLDAFKALLALAGVTALVGTVIDIFSSFCCRYMLPRCRLGGRRARRGAASARSAAAAGDDGLGLGALPDFIAAERMHSAKASLGATDSVLDALKVPLFSDVVS